MQNFAFNLYRRVQGGLEKRVADGTDTGGPFDCMRGHADEVWPHTSIENADCRPQHTRRDFDTHADVEVLLLE